MYEYFDRLILFLNSIIVSIFSITKWNKEESQDEPQDKSHIVENIREKTISGC
tara:strand:- start:148 stop:306 length:159 start_codon:yes stop_codon:yes gene_type:complete